MQYFFIIQNKKSEILKFLISFLKAWSATYWANYGMPLEKIVLGIPTYARTYNLVVPISQGLDVPVSGPGLGGGKLNCKPFKL